jgi:hypothetical protein
MATITSPAPFTTVETVDPADRSGSATGARGQLSPQARARRGLTVAAVVFVAIFVVTAVLISMATEVSTAGAVGFGAYLAFWLGGGFGLIFGSAASFGGDH